MKTPLIQRPVYLSGAPLPDDTGQKVAEVCQKAAPFGGLVGATLLGATAAYFVPKIFDAVLLNWGRYQEQDQSEHVDLDVEPRDD